MIFLIVPISCFPFFRFLLLLNSVFHYPIHICILQIHSVHVSVRILLCMALHISVVYSFSEILFHIHIRVDISLLCIGVLFLFSKTFFLSFSLKILMVTV